MRKLAEYLFDYYRQIDLIRFSLCTAFTGLLIFLNYHYRIDFYIRSVCDGLQRTIFYSLLFLTVFSVSYFIVSFRKNLLKTDRFFFLLLVIAPVMFAGKMSFTLPTSHLAPPLAFPDGRFWTAAIHWPVKGIFLFSLMVVLWRWGKFKYPYLGLAWKPNELAWYLKLFLYIFPFLILASLSADFTQTYPRLKAVFFLESITPGYPLYFLIYELCYGTDFFTIEVFFRGFLVLAFVRYAGVNAILPMAAFYCAIHFGKPLAECISSYFGGILLGTVVYRQQSVWGGLLIHLGIAWSMEILSLLHLIS